MICNVTEKKPLTSVADSNSSGHLINTYMTAVDWCTDPIMS